MKLIVFSLLALSTFMLSACAADTHLRHDVTSRSSGDIPGNPY